MSKRQIPEVKVGHQDFNNYVVAILRCFRNASTVHVLARGNSIGKGVIASNIATRTADNIQIDDVEISDEELEFVDRETNQPRKVTLTNIRIVMTKVK